MTTLTETEVRYLTLLREVIQERGADYIYSPPEFSEGSCVYVDWGNPTPTGSCLLGRLMVDKLHLDPSRIIEGMGFCVPYAEETLPVEDFENLSTEFTNNILYNAQRLQDDGVEYGKLWDETLRNLERTFDFNPEEWKL